MAQYLALTLTLHHRRGLAGTRQVSGMAGYRQFRAGIVS